MMRTSFAILAAIIPLTFALGASVENLLPRNTTQKQDLSPAQCVSPASALYLVIYRTDLLSLVRQPEAYFRPFQSPPTRLP